MQRRNVYLAATAGLALVLIGSFFVGSQKSVGSQALPNVDPLTKVYVTASIAELEGSVSPSQFASLANSIDHTVVARSALLEKILSGADEANKNSRLIHTADRKYEVTITKVSLDGLLSLLPDSDKVYTYSEQTTDLDTGKEVLANKAIIRLSYDGTNYVILTTYASPLPN
jgi:hypothetical protein